MKRLRGTWAVLAGLLPGLAFGAIGRVEVLEGTASRHPMGGVSRPLAVGADVEVKDTLEVGPKSNLKLTLNDGSVLMLGEGSQLFINVADFEGQERKGFVARLGLGKLWASVKKALAGSDAKFEVETDRAVAGVRGTRFRVDAAAPTYMGALSPRTLVQVAEGQVQVMPRMLVRSTPLEKASKERTQAPGSQEVTQEQWTERIIQLQADRQVVVDAELGTAKVGTLDRKVAGDAFGRFVTRNQGPKTP
ncbi:MULTISPECIES: FecR domain-containing protein [Corallococcus]|uniref:FecR family protein n=1 Tax=Corallococcus TaxID=83461 RepID=UPI0011C342C1|nr:MULTISPECIES: FecR family protein [Corallococcus]